MVKASITALFLLFGSAIVSVAAQQCGPTAGNTICAAGKCCSQHGWCDTTPAHCDPANCLSAFSGAGSSCAKKATTTVTVTTKTTSTSVTTATSAPGGGGVGGVVPNIDVCGSAVGGVSCPGAGAGGYFYRCCSSGGHCGPKNDIQDQALYCGAGCQAGFGACDSRTAPAEPAAPHGTAQAGETCGPIVNKMCATGLCCSGSNFCGTTADFCGAANWCQAKWGRCN